MKPAYTHTADRSQMTMPHERQQHTTNSSVNGSSSGTHFRTKKETHLKPRCGMWTGQAAKNKKVSVCNYQDEFNSHGQ